MLRACGLTGYQLGTSKVFLRAGQMAVLDKVRTDKLNAASTVLQRHARGLIERRRYAAAQQAVLRMQVREQQSCAGLYVMIGCKGGGGEGCVAGYKVLSAV